MDQSANLLLPYIMPSQAQKHVTHNEAVRMLDAIVHLAVLDRDLAAPPVSPADGDRYIVAEGATGPWAGRSAAVVAWQDGAWAYFTPRRGWLAFVIDEPRLIVFDGTGWIDAAVHSLNPAPLVGVNALADATNRLAVKAEASLFDHEADDHRLKINKAAAGATATVLFQSGYSGRAEFGLAGDDDWHVKVSPDGAAWTEALRVDAATGRVSLPAGLALLDDDQVLARRHVREALAANRTYHVRPDGSDANSGLVDSASGAFLTVQKALDAASGIDFRGYTVTIQLADGSYNAPLVVPRCVGQTGAANLVINGNPSSPAGVVVSANAAAAIELSAGAQIRLQNFELRTTAAGSSLSVRGTGAYCEIHTGMRFGASAGAMIDVRQGRCIATAGYTVAGNAARRVWVRENGVYIEEFRTVTYTGTPAFSAANVDAVSGYLSSASSTHSGAATGKRYSVSANGLVLTGGGGASFYPGDAAGTTATGGQYA